MNTLNRFQGSLLGLAIGDAVGATVEFVDNPFPPVTDMVGGGKYNLPKGAWTDDTSMALCLAESLTTVGYDPIDQMRLFLKWMTTGHWSSLPKPFGTGRTVSQSLIRFSTNGLPYAGIDAEDAAGNGSLMRIAPIPMFAYPDFNKAIELAGDHSKTTHKNINCVDACKVFSGMLIRAFNGESKEAILSTPFDFEITPSIQSIVDQDYRSMHVEDIKGTGYVVDSLRAALWCFDSTDDFRSAILVAANLGDDADTTAAICGQIAGAYYGLEGIPEQWVKDVFYSEEIRDLATKLHDKTISCLPKV